MKNPQNSPHLALIGAGKWGKNLARNFYELGVLHTICDDETVLEKYKELYPSVSLRTNYQEVLDDPEIHQTALATPAKCHFSHAKNALLSGKDVYVEKPLCLNSREGEELVSLAKKEKRILMIGHLLQYHPYIRKLQETVKNGKIGKLQYISSHRLNLGCIRKEENVLWSFAPHDISVILSLCGKRLPKTIHCTGASYVSQNIYDVSMMNMRFDEDVHAHIYVNWLNPFKEQKLTVVGSSGMLVFDDTEIWERKLFLRQDYLSWETDSTPVAHKKPGKYITVPQGEPLYEECLHFIQCCAEKKEARTNGDEGLRVLQVLEAAQNSLDEGGKNKILSPHHTESNYFSHSSSFVEPSAKIGKGSKIWHFSHIMKNAEIGKFCNIGQNVLISPGVVLGRNVKVQNNVSIYAGVICEDNVFLGPSMVFTNIRNPRSDVNRRGQYKKTILRRGCTVGANATIVCDIELGEYCFVAAGAVVTKNVKPYAIVAGNPARQIGWMSRHGERLNLPLSIAHNQIETAKCPETKEVYCLRGDELSIVEEQFEPLLNIKK